MGAVLAASHAFTRRRVALKVVEDGTSAMDRILIEARAAASVEHPSLADVYDCGYDEGERVAFVAQRLLVGCDLRAKLSVGGPMPPKLVIALLAPVMDALHQVHLQGVVHRDVKPENLFLTHDRDGRERVVLLDFGVARLPGERVAPTTTVVGSPSNMSPEQVRGDDDVGPQSDVWSMGVVLFELISGVPPFRGTTVPATFHAIMSGEVPRLDRTCPGVPTKLADVVFRSMSRDLEQRYASMWQLREALLGCDAPASIRPAARPLQQSGEINLAGLLNQPTVRVSRLRAG